MSAKVFLISETKDDSTKGKEDTIQNFTHVAFFVSGSLYDIYCLKLLHLGSSWLPSG